MPQPPVDGFDFQIDVYLRSPMSPEQAQSVRAVLQTLADDRAVLSAAVSNTGSLWLTRGGILCQLSWPHNAPSPISLPDCFSGASFGFAPEAKVSFFSFAFQACDHTWPLSETAAAVAAAFDGLMHSCMMARFLDPFKQASAHAHFALGRRYGPIGANFQEFVMNGAAAREFFLSPRPPR